jgi:hypothetical protein
LPEDYLRASQLGGPVADLIVSLALTQRAQKSEAWQQGVCSWDQVIKGYRNLICDRADVALADDTGDRISDLNGVSLLQSQNISDVVAVSLIED